MTDVRRDVLSTAGNHHAVFVEQFADRAPTGDPVQLLVYLDPTLNPAQLSTAVNEIVYSPEVVETRWVNAAGLPVLSDSLRAALAGFEVRITASSMLDDTVFAGSGGAHETGAPEAAGDPGRHLITLFNAADKAVLVHLIAHDGLENADQRTLDLANLVDQAIRHVWDRRGRDLDLADVEPALRCTRCRRIVGAGESLEALDACAGELCGDQQLRSPEPCDGVLRPIMFTAAPRLTPAEAQP